MDEIFYKFLNKYFLNGEKYVFKQKNIIFIWEKIVRNLFFAYFLCFLIYFFSIWFTIDIGISWLTIGLFCFSIIPIFLANWYVLAFLTRYKEISKFGAWIYILILLLVIPLYFLFNWIFDVSQWIAYYFFYMFFVFLYFTILPWLSNLVLNFFTTIKIIKSVAFLVLKSFFVKLDRHNIVKIVNKMGIKKISHSDIVKHLQKLREEFKIYGGILAFYTFINLVFWVSIYGVYSKYVHPFMVNTKEYIEFIADGSKGLFMLYNVGYIMIFIWVTLAFAYLIIHTFFMYMEIYFFELLEERIKKLKRKNK